jgi:2-amino-4-hydroxy-6-hydroxymethyldihydropteridine diphosphokinase
MNEVYLCLGGNLGDGLANLNRACELIENKAGKIMLKSSVYRSQAWGMDKAPDFFNQVIKIETEISAQVLIGGLLEIEKEMGRERKGELAYQNRIMDIDILFFNKEVIKTDNLEIPHPRLHLRNFVLRPMLEIVPDFMHPVFNKTIRELAEICPDKGEIKTPADAL